MDPTGDDRPEEAEGNMKGVQAGAACFGSGCTLNRKRITSLAAIVAPQTCTLVRGAASVSALARPAYSISFPSARFLSVLFSFVFLCLFDKVL